jgi:hypothetical protein
LALEPRAELPDEDSLEAGLFLPPARSPGATLVTDDGPHRWQRLTSGYSRSGGFVRELRALYGGKCQICEWSPSSLYGADLCEAHHWHWLSRGGRDDLENLVLLCPNHHRATHGCDAVLDFEGTLPVFDFGTAGREPLRLDRHLGAPRAA